MTLALVTAASATASAEGITWSGDFKFRHERLDQEVVTSDYKKYNQERLSFKLSAMATPVENVKVEARLTTGSGRTSTNQTTNSSTTATTVGQNYDFKLDRINAGWTAVENLVLTAGRMGVKYHMAGGSDMLWDNDVNLDGLHAGYKMEVAGLELLANAGSFQMRQTTTNAGKDATLQGYQLAAKGSVGETKYAISASLFNFNNYGQTFSITNTNGKTLEYQVFNPGLEVKLPFSLPVTVFADYAKNVSGNTLDKGTGTLFGLKLNGLKDAGSWVLSYDYRNLEKYTTAEAFADSESFYSNSTTATDGGKGHRIKAAYQINSALNLGVNYFNAKANIAANTTTKDVSRLQFDLNAKF